MSDYLPQDILINILARLPAKTLLQFRCVSKTWHSLISSPAFIAHHLSNATIRNNDLLFFKCQSSEDRRNRYFLYPDKDFPKCNGQELDSPLETQQFDPNQPPRYTETHLVGSSNGLFFQYHFYFDYLESKYVCKTALWNPSIRKTVPVPRPTVPLESHLYFENHFGFGFDSINHDYKVVRVGYLQCQPYHHFEKQPPLVEVYSMKSRCWRMVDDDLKCVINKYSSSSAFVNGACHWAAKTKELSGDTNVIVYFNLADEKIGEIIVPDGVVCRHYNALTVTVFDGLLSLVELSGGYHGAPKSSIWAMKEYGDSQSWTKLFNIEHIGRLIGSFVGFKKNGEMFFFAGQELTSYFKTKNGSCRILGTNIMSSVETFYLNSYMESLVLLNETSSSLADPSSNEANGESKKHSSHVAYVNKEEEKTKKGKKVMGSLELVGAENGVLLGDHASCTSRATSGITSNNEGIGASKVLDFGIIKEQETKGGGGGEEEEWEEEQL